MLEQTLARFRALRPETTPWSYPYAATFGDQTHDHHVVIGTMTHGNEVGPLAAVVEAMEALTRGALRFGGRVTFVVGNPEAGLQDQRFLEADLNRVFVDSDLDTHEHRRSRELRPILDTATVFLDFHQTILDSARPFWIHPWSERVWHYTRALQTATVSVTRPGNASFSSGTCCADEYVRKVGSVGFTVELGQAGFTDKARTGALQAITDLLALQDAIATGQTTLEAAAAAKPDLEFVGTVHSEDFTSAELALRPGCINFQPVVAGEVLSAPGTPELVAPCDGMLLFPKYPDRSKALPGQIFQIVAPMAQHPVQAYPFTA